LIDGPQKQGLYDPRHEHDACGVGFVADVKGRRSHQIVRNALEVLRNLEHRGASGCDANSGDGAGILVQTPHEFLLKECSFELPAFGHYAAGMVFLPVSSSSRQRCEKILEQVVEEEGQRLIGWRDVPTNDSLPWPNRARIQADRSPGLYCT
jgi:glutamate synthase (ferredoxin)